MGWGWRRRDGTCALDWLGDFEGGCNNFQILKIHPCPWAVSPANASALAADLNHFATASIGVVAGDSFNLGSDFNFHFVFLFSVSISVSLAVPRSLELDSLHSRPDVNKNLRPHENYFLDDFKKPAEPLWH